MLIFYLIKKEISNYAFYNNISSKFYNIGGEDNCKAIDTLIINDILYKNNNINLIENNIIDVFDNNKVNSNILTNIKNADKEHNTLIINRNSYINNITANPCTTFNERIIVNSTKFIIKVSLNNSNIDNISEYIFPNNYIKILPKHLKQTKRCYHNSIASYIYLQVGDITSNNNICIDRGLFGMYFKSTRQNNKTYTVISTNEINNNQAFIKDYYIYLCVKTGITNNTDITYSKELNDIIVDGTAEFVCAGKAATVVNFRGSKTERPILNNENYCIGFQYFDTTLNKPIWWTGSTWVDANGNNPDATTDEITE